MEKLLNKLSTPGYNKIYFPLLQVIWWNKTVNAAISKTMLFVGAEHGYQKDC